MHSSKKEIQITISEDCNLNCIYCYEKSKSHKVITLAKAKEIINKEIYCSDLEEAVIYFHGGEIGLHFDVIVKIYNWVKTVNSKVKILFSASTNGTLIHGSIKNWLSNHKSDFILGLSIDGTKEMQDTNRSNSFDKIDLPFFKNTWPNQIVKMTISPLTIDKTYEGISFLINQGFKVSANLAYGCDWDKVELKRIYARELQKLSNFYLSNPNIDLPIRPLIKDLCYLGKCIVNNIPQEHKKWCGTGQYMVCYSPEGLSYPCQMFLPSSGNNIPIPEILESIDVSPVCQKCKILAICPSCYGYNFIINRSIIKAPDGLCDYTKLESLCYSYILSSMLKDPQKYIHTRNFDDVTRAYCIKGVKYIQDSLIQELSCFI